MIQAKWSGLKGLRGTTVMRSGLMDEIEAALE